MFREKSIAVIIPALNEEACIAGVVSAIDRSLIDRVLVADNGSSDQTAEVAHKAGAEVVFEPRRGYGSACLKAMAAVPDADVLVYLDGDGSDDPAEIPVLLEALVDTPADVVIGSRVLGQAEPGSLTPVQRFGNALTCTLVRLLWGVRYTDLGPFRAVTRSALDKLDMADPDFGWTIEMQVKAAQLGMHVVEVPVSYRNRRAGQSKVSGNLKGSFLAGKRIMGYVAEAKWKELSKSG
jgi:glycosyltransferase involved in cell wall biosynthesis